MEREYSRGWDEKLQYQIKDGLLPTQSRYETGLCGEKGHLKFKVSVYLMNIFGKLEVWGRGKNVVKKGYTENPKVINNLLWWWSLWLTGCEMCRMNTMSVIQIWGKRICWSTVRT